MEKIEEMFSSIFESIIKNENEKKLAKTKEFADQLKNHICNPTKPDVFSAIIRYEFSNVLDALAAHMHEQDSTAENYQRLNFLYTNYDFLSAHINKLIIRRCNSSGVYDKSSHILSIYKKFLLSEI